jgi:hypothetical protein
MIRSRCQGNNARPGKAVDITLSRTHAALGIDHKSTKTRRKTNSLCLGGKYFSFESIVKASLVPAMPGQVLSVCLPSAKMGHFEDKGQ